VAGIVLVPFHLIVDLLLSAVGELSGGKISDAPPPELTE